MPINLHAMQASTAPIETLSDQLISVLRRAAGLLPPSQSELKAEVIETCDRCYFPVYRVVVFGPFNYGKSTLLNALLGQKALPMDLVPTTGTAITIKYGPTLHTCLLRTDGSSHRGDGTKALQSHAVLDEQRRMRSDIAEVVLYCPHPLLKLGVELVDLPGTDDRQAQNDLVQQQLKRADLVLQLLDARKLMSLDERQQLRSWLRENGIEAVIFVVNFLNLMETGDRQQVLQRLRDLSESFRAQLPDGVSNLYRVDALPALRARLKGDAAAASQSGLSALEAALQIISTQMANGRSPAQILPRLSVFATTVIALLHSQIALLENTEVDTQAHTTEGDIGADMEQRVETQPTRPYAKEQRRTEIKAKAGALLIAGFRKSLHQFQSWLTPQNLQAHYRLGLARAIADGTVEPWLSQHLLPAWQHRQASLVDWMHQGFDLFEGDRLSEKSLNFEALAVVPLAMQSASDFNEWELATLADRYLTDLSKAGLSALSDYAALSEKTMQQFLKDLSTNRAFIREQQTKKAQIHLLQVTCDELRNLAASASAIASQDG